MTTPLPEWMEALTEALDLGDTPSPVTVDDVTAFLDVVKHIEFTAQGWARVKQMLVSDESISNTPLFQRIINASEDDLMLFTAFIAIPYSLARNMGYEARKADRLIQYFTASYVLAMSRGYDLGAEDSRAERRTRDE
jgi:hypothetical protein